jgi:hypothetical protein
MVVSGSGCGGRTSKDGNGTEVEARPALPFGIFLLTRAGCPMSFTSPYAFANVPSR